ncbi:uncharacterized protein LOC125498408 [Beta vulgaris subsp. vulgaris]|uniref:uncharacterized protein LOC125498408 n=1 Tax=Beta vulgaris subsp. vulgaris TaxID=3555 RepID=UPI0020373AD2|nr:uncharacterized protein LOC125498408 [Beta vulgaris subsp. vulgaris]
MTETNYCTHSSLKEENFGDRFAFTCNGCTELGYGSCYTCTSTCNYHLHTACLNAPPVISHPFFAQGQFVLAKSMLPPYDNHQELPNLCAACCTIVEGWRYVLTINDGNTIFIHPCCMTLPHPTLRSTLENVNCVHCQSTNVGNEEVKGWACVKDGFAVHVKCMKDMLHMDWQRKCYSPDHEYTNEERNFGTQPNQGRFRKRNVFFFGLSVVAHVVSVFDPFGVIGPIHEAIVEFANSVWGA